MNARKPWRSPDMALGRFLQLLLLAPFVKGSCLPEAISERRYLSGDAVRIVAVERNSAQILSAVAQVIIEEILGYHAVVTNSSGSSATPNVWLSLACGGSGCDEHLVDQSAPEQLGCLGFAPEDRARSRAQRLLC